MGKAGTCRKLGRHSRVAMPYRILEGGEVKTHHDFVNRLDIGKSPLRHIHNAPKGVIGKS
jgi:hypothetical protein